MCFSSRHVPKAKGMCLGLRSLLTFEESIGFRLMLGHVLFLYRFMQFLFHVAIAFHDGVIFHVAGSIYTCSYVAEQHT